MLKIEHYSRIIPYMRFPDISGDQVFFKEYSDCWIFAVIDGLGHGVEANHAAVLTLNYLEEKPALDLVEAVKGLHEYLLKSRGVVIALCILNKQNGKLFYTGVGNITTRIFGRNSRQLVPRDGVVGCRMPTPKLWETEVESGDFIFLYSDGIREHIDFSNFPGINHQSSKAAAELIIDKYAKESDDVSLLAVKVVS